MGRYLKQGNESFEKSVNSEIYIDKIGLIKYTNRVLITLQGYVCIRRPDEKIRKKVQENWESLAKPLDGLGIFEKIFTQIGAVTGDERVPLQKKAVIVMCADNGIVEEGISQSGQEVTYQVAESMGKRKSSVCLMAAQANAKVIPIDVGIAAEETPEGVWNKKVSRGTKNFLKQPAMTEEEALAAIEAGIDSVKKCKEDGMTLLATGEMGIGNTTTSSAVAAALLNCETAAITGKGAGLSDAGLLHKIAVIDEARKKYQFDSKDVFRILCSVGGLDIAGLCGVCIGGAVYGVPVVLDGVISAVAALVAERLVPGVKDFLIASHKSREPAAALILQELGVHPVIDGSLALGEGTGAVLMFGLLDTVHAVYGNRTTFSDIRVEAYKRFTDV